MISDRFGRKKVLILAAILFLVSAIASALPNTITGLVVARIIGGVGVGIASMLWPLYLAELRSAAVRGRDGRVVSVSHNARDPLRLFL